MRKAGLSVGCKVLGPADTDSDATVTGSVLQTHLSTLQSFLRHPEPPCRLSTLHLLGTLLRQGMVCPLDVMGHLVSLQSDVEEGIRGEALRLIQTEDEKHPMFLDNRICEGIETGYDHIVHLTGGSEGSSGGSVRVVVEGMRGVEEEETGVVGSGGGGGTPYYYTHYDALYQSCIQSVRKRRLDLITSILRRADSHFPSPPLPYSYYSTTTTKTSTTNTSTTPTLLPSSNNEHSDKKQQQHNNVSTATSVLSTVPTSVLSTVPTSVQVGASSRSTKHQLQLQQLVVGSNNSSNKEILVPLKQTRGRCDRSVYLCSLLAHLPYEYVDEPLQTIQWVSRTVCCSALQLLTAMTRALATVGGITRVEGAMQAPHIGGRGGGGTSTTNTTTTITPHPGRGHCYWMKPSSHLLWQLYFNLQLQVRHRLQHVPIFWRYWSYKHMSVVRKWPCFD